MHFGDVPVGQAEGAILAHALKTEGLRFKKGRILSAADVAALADAGVESIVAAVLEPGDVVEDAAADRLGRALSAPGVTIAPAATGRVNLFAAHNGLFVADRTLIDRLNRIDPAITFACLADHVQVAEGAMVATIKIIPLAVPGASLEEAVRAIEGARLIEVKPFRAFRTGLVSTMLPSLKPSVMDKTADLMRQRLAASGSEVTGEARVPHETAAVTEALRHSLRDNDLVILVGASAVVDQEDVIPAAVTAAGGTLRNVGMPVDPGNLLVLGEVDGVPVIGAPGCARSPKENGFDWVLARVLAGERPSQAEISGMGVGGLLMEIPSRPQPRAATGNGERPVETILLAAGRASRMGEAGGHKLLARFDGEPLVRRTARAALASKAATVHVVTGYREEAVAAALSGLAVDVAYNPDYASGMASSLGTGIARLSPKVGGVLILLADMPGLESRHLDLLVDAFRAHGGRAVIRAANEGRRGNPVILPRAAFDEIKRLSGDMGARPIVESGEFEVIDVEIGAAAHLDVDTPEAVVAAGGILEGHT